MRVFVLMVMTMLLFSPSKTATASSQDACAIWICLPGGFPSGCGGAYSEFKKRIKKGRDPLPKLSTCTTGPNGEKIDGHGEDRIANNNNNDNSDGHLELKLKTISILARRHPLDRRAQGAFLFALHDSSALLFLPFFTFL